MEVSGPPAGPEPERDPATGRVANGLPTFAELRARFFTPGSFARNVLTLTTGTTLANLIPIAVSPILSRLYSPADFGLFALYTGVAALLSVAATGRYEMAIVLPAEDEHAFELLGLSLLLAAGVAVVSLLVVAVFHSGLLAALHAPALTAWLWLLPLGVLLLGAAQALTNWLNRKRAYRRIAESRIAQAVATAILAIVLARAGLGAGSLIVSAVLGQALAAALLAWRAWGDLRGSTLRWSRAGMEREGIRYRDFPRINAMHALFDNLTASGSLILLSHAFGAIVVGQYSMVMRVLSAPVTFVGSAISQVFYQRAADVQNRGGDLPGLIRALLRRTVWIALPCALLLLFAAPVLFRLVFGAAWVPAGRYAQLLAPYTFFYFLAAPLAFLPFVLKRQWESFLLSGSGNLLFLFCVAAGGWMRSPELGFAMLSVVESLFFGYYIIWMQRIAGERPMSTAKSG